MRIIALRGGDNTGKTSTLKIAHQLLIKAGGLSTCKLPIPKSPSDFSDIVDYKKQKVAFFTMGDYADETKKAIHNYNTLKVDVLILASNIKFVTPIRLIVTFPNNLVIKTVAVPSNLANDLTANTTDANTIFALI